MSSSTTKKALLFWSYLWLDIERQQWTKPLGASGHLGDKSRQVKDPAVQDNAEVHSKCFIPLALSSDVVNRASSG